MTLVIKVLKLVCDQQTVAPRSRVVFHGYVSKALCSVCSVVL